MSRTVAPGRPDDDDSFDGHLQYLERLFAAYGPDAPDLVHDMVVRALKSAPHDGESWIVKELLEAMSRRKARDVEVDHLRRSSLRRCVPIDEAGRVGGREIAQQGGVRTPFDRVAVGQLRKDVLGILDDRFRHRRGYAILRLHFALYGELTRAEAAELLGEDYSVGSLRGAVCTLHQDVIRVLRAEGLDGGYRMNG